MNLLMHQALLRKSMLGIWSPIMRVTLVVSASVARKDMQASVKSRWQFSASSKAARNSASICVLALSNIISPSMAEIFRSFSFRSIILVSSIFFTSRLLSALMRCCFCLVTSYSTRTFSFSAAMKKSIFIFYISQKFFRMRSGMFGLVILMESISMPGAHTERSLLRDSMSASSSWSKMSMYISWRECLEQNWLISWWILSEIQYFSYISVQFSTVSYTNSFRSLLTTSTLSKQTRVPLEVPQGMLLTTSVRMLVFIQMNSSQKGILKWGPGSLRVGCSTPNFLQMPTQPSWIWWQPARRANTYAAMASRMQLIAPIYLISIKIILGVYIIFQPHQLPYLLLKISRRIFRRPCPAPSVSTLVSVSWIRLRRTRPFPPKVRSAAGCSL